MSDIKDRIAKNLADIAVLESEHAKRMAVYKEFDVIRKPLSEFVARMAAAGLRVRTIGSPSAPAPEHECLHMLTPIGEVTIHLEEIPERMREAFKL